MIHGDLSEPAWRPKVSTEKKNVPTRSKNVTRKKNDHQEKLMAFAQVVQNEAFLELEPV